MSDNEKKIEDISSRVKCLYVICDNMKRVKIGVSKNAKQRFRTIETSSGVTIQQSFCSELLFNAGKLESLLKSYFKFGHINGEWFDVRFDDVVNEAKKYLDNYKLTKEKINLLRLEDKEKTKKMMKYMESFITRKHSVNFPVLDFNGTNVFLLNENEIDSVLRSIAEDKEIIEMSENDRNLKRIELAKDLGADLEDIELDGTEGLWHHEYLGDIIRCERYYEKFGIAI